MCRLTTGMLVVTICAACTPIPAAVTDDDAAERAAESTASGELFDYYPEARLLRMGERVPDLEMHDRDDHTLSLSAFRGGAVVLAFVSAADNNDNDAEMLRRLVEFDSIVGPALAEEVQILALVLDTSPASATALAAREAVATGAGVHLSWTFLGATPRNAALLAASFGVVAWQYADGSVGHSFNTVVIDPQGRLVDQFPGLEAWSPRDLVAAASLAAGH